MAYSPFTPPKVNVLHPSHGLQAPTSASPWLLFAYPWMPFPRRVVLFLREKRIPDSMVHIVHVRGAGEHDNVDAADAKFPPKPAGSLPILAVTTSTQQDYSYIRQSNAIMIFLDDLCNDGQLGFFSPHGSMLGLSPPRGSNPGINALIRARINEVIGLADECMIAWNSVRTFGTGAGTISLPQAAKEMLRWIRGSLITIERFMSDRDMTLLKQSVFGHVTMADIVLYTFLDFVKDCYGVDMTIGSGETVKDVYGGEVKEEYPKLAKFYQAFSMRDSARRYAEKGEMAPEMYLKRMHHWLEGVL